MNLANDSSRRPFWAEAQKTFAAQIERARDVKIQDVVARRGGKLTRRGSYLVGPCLVCGGHDRFEIKMPKSSFGTVAAAASAATSSPLFDMSTSAASSAQSPR
jgi:hypothetical protein